jgi:hypothetical protein
MRSLVAGIVLWLVGTIGIRLAGERLLHPGHPLATLILYAVSFALMAFLVPRIVRGDRAAVTLLMLPTLILDGLACVFFTAVYPNVDPAAAGLFGGWMLICCGGAVVGVWLRR